MRHNPRLKTAGPQTAHLIATLYDRAQTTFTNSDVTAITGLESPSARSLVRNAEARGLVTRLKPGLFVLVPPELGRDRKSTRLNSSHLVISYAVFCLKKKK